MGGLTSSEIVLVSLNLQEYANYLHDGKVTEFHNLITKAAKQLENCKVDFIVICSNTAHLAYSYVTKIVNVPILHISDCCALEIKRKKLQRIGFVGTKFSMQKDFIVDRLQQHGLQVFVPSNDEECNEIQQIIEGELSRNIINNESKQVFLRAINQLISKFQIEGIILGCTEIQMLVKENDLDIPIFDSMAIHVQEIVNAQLGKTDLANYHPTTKM
ncbi:hypothetical protein ABK040_008040 [Willaertia magna]